MKEPVVTCRVCGVVIKRKPHESIYRYSKRVACSPAHSKEYVKMRFSQTGKTKPKESLDELYARIDKKYERSETNSERETSDYFD